MHIFTSRFSQSTENFSGFSLGHSMRAPAAPVWSLAAPVGVQQMCGSSTVSVVQTVSAAVVLMVSVLSVVRLGLLMMKDVQRLVASLRLCHCRHLSRLVTVSPECTAALLLWGNPAIFVTRHQSGDYSIGGCHSNGCIHGHSGAEQ